MKIILDPMPIKGAAALIQAIFDHIFPLFDGGMLHGKRKTIRLEFRTDFVSHVVN